MAMIETLKITLLSGRFIQENWEAEIEVNDEWNLSDLHFAILDAVEFDDDHSFSFFYARIAYRSARVYFHDEDLDETHTIKNMLPAPPKKSLFYLFDWGDEWIFRVSKSRKSLQEPQPGTVYPRLVSESGTRPIQYPNDDEEFEEDDSDEEGEEDQ